MDEEMQVTQRRWSWAAEHPLLIIGLLVILVLGPFINKAFHMDDPLFLWSAERIQKHPLDFYGFDVNWYGYLAPMSITNQNPPAVAYFLALVASLFGWREIALHAAFMPVAFAAGAGIYHLARIWCGRPLLAAIVAMITPVFLVSGTTLMCDMLVLALWVWALVVWESALKSGGPFRFWAAGALAGLAVLTKYGAVTGLPLLLILGLLRKRRPGVWMLALLAPVAMLAAYELITAKLYGHGLFAMAADFAAAQRTLFKGGWEAKLITESAFAGGCLLPLLFFAPLLWRRALTLCGGVVVFGLCLIMVSSLRKLGPMDLSDGDGPRWGYLMQTALLMTCGLQLLVLTAVELWRRRDTVAIMLALWIMSGLLFSTVLNWTVNARSLLSVVPAAAILLVRHLEREHPARTAGGRLVLPLIASVGVSLCVAAADFQLANSARVVARYLTTRYHSPTRPIWFMGHWGFQYYMEKLGAQPVDFIKTTLQPGDVLVVPSNNSNIDWPKPGEAELLKIFKRRVFPWLSTMQVGAGAGFYDADYGPLPFVVGPALPETYTVFQASRPLHFRSSMANYRLGGETPPGQPSPPPPGQIGQ